MHLRFPWFPYAITSFALDNYDFNVRVGKTSLDESHGYKADLESAKKKLKPQGIAMFWRQPDYDFPDEIRKLKPAAQSDRFTKAGIDMFGVHLLPGLIPMLGSSKSGKTTITHRFARLTGMPILHYSEPDDFPYFEKWKGEANSMCHHGHFRSFLCHLTLCLMNPKVEGLVTDSFKRSLYGTKGNLTRTGINISAISELSGLSRIAKKLNKTVLINVGVLDESALDMAVHAATLSAESTFRLERSGSNVKYIFRTRNVHFSEEDGRIGSISLDASSLPPQGGPGAPKGGGFSFSQPSYRQTQPPLTHAIS